MYPSLKEVNEADRTQICRWYRFLSSPGNDVIGGTDFEEILQRQVKIMNRISERFKELGGMTPAISKAIGWS